MGLQRVVSLIPSATEFVCALGCEDRLVGRSHECDFPVSVKGLPVCTAPKINVGGSSAQIHEEVKAFFARHSEPEGRCHSRESGNLRSPIKAFGDDKCSLRPRNDSGGPQNDSRRRQDDTIDPLNDALSIYSVHTQVLKQLKPDLIVTQSQCEVCAVSLKDVERAVSQFVGSRPEIVSLEPDTLSDVWQNIGRVAEALGVFERGTSLIKKLSERMVSISSKASGLKNRPTVAYIEWIEPLMSGGNWMPELVELAGGINLFGIAGKHSPWMKWEELAARDPEVIAVSPCGFGIERTKADLHFLTDRPDWRKLRAVRDCRVFALDGNQYFNRPGPRLVESLEILAEIIHPEVFRFDHEGKGWKRL